MDSILDALSSIQILTHGGLLSYQPFLETISFYKYLLLIVLTPLQGPVVMMLSGIFLRLEVFEFWPAYFALMIGDLIGDTLWYGVGYYLGHPFIRKFGRFFSITEEHIKTLERLFKHYHNRILILSKVTMGFGFALVTLVAAGLSRVPFKKYILLNAVGQIFWTALLMGLGYFLGHLYTNVDSLLGKFTTIAILVILFAGIIGFGKYIRGNIIKKYSS